MRRFALLGAGVWAGATLAIRFLPAQWLNLPTAGLGAILAGGVAGVVVLARLVVREVPSAMRPAAMVAFVLPGMCGDAATTALFGICFPNLPPEDAGWFGGAMLLGYAAMLAAASKPTRTNSAAA